MASVDPQDVRLELPSHVPRELVWDHDIDSFPMSFADPYIGTCDAIHAGPDIVWSPHSAHGGRPGWILTRYRDLEEVYIDSRRFSAAHSHGAARFLGFELPLLPTESDPPLHRDYRQVIQPHFVPSAVKALEGMVRATCEELISRFEDRDGCEFVADFSSLFPSWVFLELMGMPRDMLSRFFEWEHAFLRGKSWEEQVSGTRAIYGYIAEFTAGRRSRSADDLTSKIVKARVGDRPITETEAIGFCMTLYLGGLDTVMNSAGWCMRHLAMDQELQARLRTNPELIPAALEELLRAYAVTSTFRTVMEDTEFRGVPMRKGDIVALPTFLAARDVRAYDRPHVIDIERRPRHLTFGSGVHNCVGIHLAKRELRVVIQAFLERFRNIRIPENDSPEWTTVMIWGIRRLPLVWDR